MSIPSQPQRFRRTWRDDAPDPSARVVMHRPITLDGMKPVGEPRPVGGPLAPESCITLEPCITCEIVVLVATDLSGAVRAKIEIARSDATWWIKAARYFLALRYGAAQIKLVSNG
jgi:hypothetical protein